MKPASQDQSSGNKTSATPPARGTTWEVGGHRGEATRGSVQSRAPCPGPWTWAPARSGPPLVSMCFSPCGHRVAAPGQRCWLYPSPVQDPGCVRTEKPKKGEKRLSRLGLRPQVVPTARPQGVEGAQELVCFRRCCHPASERVEGAA